MKRLALVLVLQFSVPYLASAQRQGTSGSSSSSSAGGSSGGSTGYSGGGGGGSHSSGSSSGSSGYSGSSSGGYSGGSHSSASGGSSPGGNYGGSHSSASSGSSSGGSPFVRIYWLTQPPERKFRWFPVELACEPLFASCRIFRRYSWWLAGQLAALRLFEHYLPVTPDEILAPFWTTRVHPGPILDPPAVSDRGASGNPRQQEPGKGSFRAGAGGGAGIEQIGIQASHDALGRPGGSPCELGWKAVWREGNVHQKSPWITTQTLY